MSVDLRRVDRLIVRTEVKIGEQEARIASLIEQGCDTRHAKYLLSMLEDGLTSFRSSKEVIVASLRVLGETGEG